MGIQTQTNPKMGSIVKIFALKRKRTPLSRASSSSGSEAKLPSPREVSGVGGLTNGSDVESRATA